MKHYPILKKRDGQGFKEIATIYAASFHEACHEFSKYCRADLSNKNDNTTYECADYFNDNDLYPNGQPSWFEGDGYYYNNELILSDDCVTDSFNEDVYTWKVVNVDDYDYQKNELAKRMSARFNQLY